MALPIKKTLHAKEQDRKDVQKQREEWSDWQKQIGIEKLIFIDESGAKTNMTRTHGRAMNGERLVDKTSPGTWQTITMISSINSEGQTQSMVINGATTKEVFIQYLEKVLIDSL